jgi:hypothetical protein
LRGRTTLLVEKAYRESFSFLAREQSRTEGELLEEMVRSYIVLAPRRSNRLGEFFEGLERRRERSVEPLSEEETLSLANEEPHAMRRERRVAP